MSGILATVTAQGQQSRVVNSRCNPAWEAARADLQSCLWTRERGGSSVGTHVVQAGRWSCKQWPQCLTRAAGPRSQPFHGGPPVYYPFLPDSNPSANKGVFLSPPPLYFFPSTTKSPPRTISSFYFRKFEQNMFQVKYTSNIYF